MSAFTLDYVLSYESNPEYLQKLFLQAKSRGDTARIPTHTLARIVCQTISEQVAIWAIKELVGRADRRSGDFEEIYSFCRDTRRADIALKFASRHPNGLGKFFEFVALNEDERENNALRAARGALFQTQMPEPLLRKLLRSKFPKVKDWATNLILKSSETRNWEFDVLILDPERINPLSWNKTIDKVSKRRSQCLTLIELILEASNPAVTKLASQKLKKFLPIPEHLLLKLVTHCFASEWVGDGAHRATLDNVKDVLLRSVKQNWISTSVLSEILANGPVYEIEKLVSESVLHPNRHADIETLLDLASVLREEVLVCKVFRQIEKSAFVRPLDLTTLIRGANSELARVLAVELVLKLFSDDITLLGTLTGMSLRTFERTDLSERYTKSFIKIVKLISGDSRTSKSTLVNLSTYTTSPEGREIAFTALADRIGAGSF